MINKIVETGIAQFILKTVRKIISLLSIDAVAARYGKNRVVFQIIPRNTTYPDDDSILIRRNDICWELNRSDYSQWKIFANVKEHGINLLSGLLKNDFVMYDIGANIGEFSIKLSYHALKNNIRNVKIYAFEPNPVIYTRMLRNIELNPLIHNSIQSENTGLADKKQDRYLSYVKHHSGCSSVTTDGNNKNTIKIKLTTIDEYLAHSGNKYPDLIKIDAEGFEYFVLKGGGQCIRDHHPLLYLEVSKEHNNKYGIENNMVIDFLKNHGYTLFIEQNQSAVPLAAIPDVNNRPDFNLLALPIDHAKI